MNAQVPVTGSRLIEADLEFRLRSGGAPAKDSAFVLCPKCEAPCFIRKSIRLTRTVKHLICHCTDTGCGHNFMAEVAFVHTFTIGNLPQPEDLPVCPREDVPQVWPPSRDGPDPDQMSMFGTGPPG